MYYTYTDHLGSIVAVTNHNASEIEKQSFDAWGVTIDNEQLTINNEGKQEIDNQQSSIVNQRGYTGHEHLREFGLINMNGRLYDPARRSL